MCGLFQTRGAVGLWSSLDWVGFLLSEMSRGVFLAAFCLGLLSAMFVFTCLVSFVQDVRLVPYQRDLGWLVFPWREVEVFDAMEFFPNSRSVP